MTRVIHTGDTHLGYRQYHSPERREDFLRAFERVIRDAIEERVDAVIHAGDLFHDRTPALPDVHGAIEILRDLRDADIPFLAIVGNHERTRDQQWLDLFETLGLATRLGSEPVEIGNAAFYGIDYVPRSKRDALEYDFDPHDAEHAALVGHGLFEPFPHADWDTERLLAASNVDFDALLLGDDHKPDRAQLDDTWITYCGSTERTSAEEREARGYNLVTFEDGVSIRRKGLDTRPFVFVDLELSPGEGPEYVRERVREENVEDAVVIVRLEGEGKEVPPARIEEFATERGALVARVNDQREFESEETTEIRFADPDDAVRERLRETTPSEAALGLDETIRDLSVADSNVRDHAKRHVEGLLEDDPEAFRTAGEVEAPEADAESGSGAESSTNAETEEDSESDDEIEVDGGAVNDEDQGTDIGSANEEGPTDEDSPSNEDSPANDDGQVTMEDYL